MSESVLIVEDEFFVAMAMEYAIEDAGYMPAGIAADMRSAMELAERLRPDIALVDVNLKDGPTGPDIGRQLNALYGCTVIYITANPRMIDPPGGAIGVIEKPCDESNLGHVLTYARSVRTGLKAQPPSGLMAFA